MWCGVCSSVVLVVQRVGCVVWGSAVCWLVWCAFHTNGMFRCTRHVYGCVYVCMCVHGFTYLYVCECGANVRVQPWVLEPSGGQLPPSGTPQVSVIVPIAGSQSIGIESCIALFKYAHELPSAEYVFIQKANTTQDLSEMVQFLTHMRKAFKLQVRLINQPGKVASLGAVC